MARRIFVHESFPGYACHCCGSDKELFFLRFRTNDKPDFRAPREVFLRLCRLCMDELKGLLP